MAPVRITVGQGRRSKRTGSGRKVFWHKARDRGGPVNFAPVSSAMATSLPERKRLSMRTSIQTETLPIVR